MNNNNHIKSLDGLRAIAVILVMTYHAGITHFGWVGVQLFFVLSGFLITGILWKEKFNTDNISYKFKKFWTRRTLRIFPLYFGYLLILGIIYIIFHFPNYYLLYIPYLATYTFNYTRTLSAWQGNPLFTHLWSLSIEEQFYLFFPFILFFTSQKFIKYFMCAVIIIAPFIRFFLGTYYANEGLTGYAVADAVYWNTLSHLDAFFLGGLIPIFSLHKKIRKPQWLFYSAVTIAFLCGVWEFIVRGATGNYLRDLGYDHGPIDHYENVWSFTCLNLLFASFILLLVSDRNNFILRKLLETKWMVNIGKVSYGMYIFSLGNPCLFLREVFSGVKIF